MSKMQRNSKILAKHLSVNNLRMLLCVLGREDANSDLTLRRFGGDCDASPLAG
jgi:hypothetical protein